MSELQSSRTGYKVSRNSTTKYREEGNVVIDYMTG